MIPVRSLAEYAIDRKAVVDDATFASCRGIVEDVRRRGDAAVREYAKRFDRVEPASFEVNTAEIEAAMGSVAPEVQAAIRTAYDRVFRFHHQGLLRGFEDTSRPGVTLGMRVVPFERAGIYVPGGLAAYPSSVCMAAAAANVAGVRETILCTPPEPQATLLCAARICGVTRVFRIGGAQAVAAMAYGTESVPACEIVAGPGNRFVTAAKKAVADDVAIDFLAGPTEVLVLSDGTTSPRFVAADLIAQAEHDPAALSILVTTSREQAEAVAREFSVQIPRLERAAIVVHALRDHGALLVAPDFDAAVAFANRLAPEHLVISTRDPMEVLPRIRHAGAVFLGEHSPVAMGDYGSGPNAILPTLGDSRRRSGLSANTFVKTITYERLTPEALAREAAPAIALATVEGLGAHRRSIEIRHEPR
ncbi:MAG: histidinol dehydrogenase [Planctomycetes bacterium]|nr:histidinol dehydrogenase [Planctomycetota bacterium]